MPTPRQGLINWLLEQANQKKPAPTPWQEALSNLEATRRALGTSATNPDPTGWTAAGIPPLAANQLTAWQNPLYGGGGGAGLAGTLTPQYGASAVPGAGSYGGGMSMDDDMMMVLDPTGYQIKQTLGEQAYQTYLAKKAGYEASAPTGPFGFSPDDWSMLSPAQRASYMNKVSGMPGGGDPASIFGLSESEWAMLTPEQQASLKNYVSRMPNATGGGGDPYGAEKMRLAWAQLAQERAMQEAQIAARRREMAAGIGQNVSQMRQQGWQAGLPWSMPKGMQFAPGFEQGGPLNQLYAMSGAQYNPQQYFLGVSNPPSSDQLMGWVAEAMNKFG